LGAQAQASVQLLVLQLTLAGLATDLQEALHVVAPALGADELLEQVTLISEPFSQWLFRRVDRLLYQPHRLGRERCNPLRQLFYVWSDLTGLEGTVKVTPALGSVSIIDVLPPEGI
jgi:hypothetical protein